MVMCSNNDDGLKVDNDDRRLNADICLDQKFPVTASNMGLGAQELFDKLISDIEDFVKYLKTISLDRDRYLNERVKTILTEVLVEDGISKEKKISQAIIKNNRQIIMEYPELSSFFVSSEAKVIKGISGLFYSKDKLVNAIGIENSALVARQLKLKGYKLSQVTIASQSTTGWLV